MLTAYNALAVRCWEDPGARRRFADSPRDALAAYGWEVPPETRVSIEFVASDADTRPIGPEQIVAHWRRGLESGELRIKIAAEPPEVAAAELDEGELASISAGAYSTPSLYPT
jgi:hypothetical protein